MPKFSISAFHKQIQPYKVPEKVEPIKKGMDDLGTSNVIQYVWNHYSTKGVNFDSFTLNDLKDAMEFMTFTHTYEDEEYSEEEEGFIPDTERNLWSIYHNMANIVYALTRMKGRIYETDDDFI